MSMVRPPVARRRRLILIALVVVLLILVGAGVLILRSPGSTSPPGSTAPGPGTSFHVVGNRILQSDGQQFVPYGFVVWCLSSPDLSCNQHTARYPNSDSDKITAAAHFWHANTVRIQVAAENLFEGDSATPNAAVVTQLDGEVALANRLGMVAILTQQTERFHGSLMPNALSVRFWSYLSKHFAHNQRVFFDLFNEPRLSGKNFGGGENAIWAVWQHGGTVTLKGETTPTTYVGMQTLVDTIRVNATNIIIAEGNHGDHDLSQLPTHVLSGGNLAYGQEPDLSGALRGFTFWADHADDTQTEWAANWGTLSDKYPIMMEALQDHVNRGFCYPDSPTVLPQLLAYLRSKHLGLIFYSLDPGLAVVGNDLTRPTSYPGERVDCSAKAGTDNTIGPGEDLLRWFTANSSNR